MHTFRKALIFLACLIVGALLINLGTAVGLSYGLSTIIFETAAFVLAYKLCDAYNKKHGIEKKEARPWICPQCGTQNEKAFVACRKCGARRPGESQK